MFISNRYSVNIVRRSGIVHRAIFISHSRWLTGGGFAHAPQIYCFSPVWSVLSLFKIIMAGYSYVTRLGRDFLGFSSASKTDAVLLHQIR